MNSMKSSSDIYKFMPKLTILVLLPLVNIPCISDIEILGLAKSVPASPSALADK